MSEMGSTQNAEYEQSEDRCTYCLGARLVDDGSTVECLDCGVTL